MCPKEGAMENLVSDWFQCYVNIQDEFGDSATPDINWFEFVSHRYRYGSLGRLLAQLVGPARVWRLSIRAPASQPILHRTETGYLKPSTSRNGYYAVKKQSHYWAEHLPGVKNDVADALSRFKPDPFATLTTEERAKIKTHPCNSTRTMQALIVSYKDTSRK